MESIETIQYFEKQFLKKNAASKAGFAYMKLLFSIFIFHQNSKTFKPSSGITAALEDSLAVVPGPLEEGRSRCLCLRFASTKTSMRKHNWGVVGGYFKPSVKRNRPEKLQKIIKKNRERSAEKSERFALLFRLDRIQENVCCVSSQQQQKHHSHKRDQQQDRLRLSV